jgi:phosphoribosylaminoimidazole-succinocarboxamide synthase
VQDRRVRRVALRTGRLPLFKTASIGHQANPPGRTPRPPSTASVPDSRIPPWRPTRVAGSHPYAGSVASMELVHSGKVRDVYADGDDLVLVASDRISVFDVVLPTPVPDKGKVLTELSLWWFDRLADIVPNHIVSATDVPSEWTGRAVRCRRLDMVKVECVARGYLTGSGLKDYQRDHAVCGIPLPDGLVEASRLPTPIFTPTTKAPLGEHDAPMTFFQVVAQEGRRTAEELRRITMEVYARGAELAAKRGIIIADTKVEIGRSPDGALILADEVLTPDSSRFWSSADYAPGRVQYPFDKQMVRDWAISTGWDRTSPAPEIPADVVQATRARYIEAYERITGLRWT